MKNLLILGSTGSIGVNTLDVIRRFPDKFRVSALTVNTRIDLLEPQIKEFRPPFVVVKDKELASELEKRTGSETKVLSGNEGLEYAASNLDYDILISAMVGFAGLIPTIESIKRGKRVALANKETLVVAGELIKTLAEKHKAEIIPVDSEHSAIFQCMAGEDPENVEKLILTASGGPFRKMNKEEFSEVTVEDALNHPNWKMGNKITIDSATMMNKGLEVIEAHWLFNLPKDKIDVVIHPQSIIHSMVQFVDGSVKAQMGLPDMRLPIQYALSFPERLQNDYPRANLADIQGLTFYRPDTDKFECLKLAYNTLESGGTAACILNAANEVAVEKFLKKEIKFSDISALICNALDHFDNHKNPDLDTIIEQDKQTREYVKNLV
jgi:1-deoxy-D-xylulose-5-phosphate reductoisomerase